MTPDAIKRLRRRMNCTQNELAQKLSLHPDTVARWEQGRAQPDRTSVERLRALQRQMKVKGGS